MSVAKRSGPALFAVLFAHACGANRGSHTFANARVLKSKASGRRTFCKRSDRANFLFPFSIKRGLVGKLVVFLDFIGVF